MLKVMSLYIYIYIHIYKTLLSFVCHVKMSNNIYKKQNIYLFKSYTSVSFKPSEAQ